MAAPVTVNPGNWSTGANWDTGVEPAASDTPTVNHAMVMDKVSNALGNMVIGASGSITANPAAVIPTGLLFGSNKLLTINAGGAISAGSSGSALPLTTAFSISLPGGGGIYAPGGGINLYCTMPIVRFARIVGQHGGSSVVFTIDRDVTVDPYWVAGAVVVIFNLYKATGARQGFYHFLSASGGYPTPTQIRVTSANGATIADGSIVCLITRNCTITGYREPLILGSSTPPYTDCNGMVLRARIDSGSASTGFGVRYCRNIAEIDLMMRFLHGVVDHVPQDGDTGIRITDAVDVHGVAYSSYSPLVTREIGCERSISASASSQSILQSTHSNPAIKLVVGSNVAHIGGLVSDAEVCGVNVGIGINASMRRCLIRSNYLFGLRSASELYDCLLLENPYDVAGTMELRRCGLFSATPITALVDEYGGRVVSYDPRTLVDAWSSLHVYAAGAIVLPVTYNGCYYKTTAGGTSGASEPTWVLQHGTTVVDGSVTWICYRMNQDWSTLLAACVVNVGYLRLASAGGAMLTTTSLPGTPPAEVTFAHKADFASASSSLYVDLPIKAQLNTKTTITVYLYAVTTPPGSYAEPLTYKVLKKGSDTALSSTSPTNTADAWVTTTVEYTPTTDEELILRISAAHASGTFYVYATSRVAGGGLLVHPGMNGGMH